MQNNQRSKISTSPRLRPSAPASEVSGENEKCKILATKGFLIARNLTSDVAILVHSNEFQLGAMLHLNSPGKEESENVVAGDAFAKSALAMILAEFETLGVTRTSLNTYAIGGSVADGFPGVTDSAMRSALAQYGLSPSNCDLGGTQMRSVWLDVETGRIIVRSQPIASALPAEAPLSLAS
jgi:chemotaxis receptor (MCP) glutamine deamidase CheD